MYLHIGGETVINTKDIIGIFDLDTSTMSYKTREFLSLAEKKDRVVNVSYELPKSYVICSEGKDFRIYICQLSPTTILKRSSGYLTGK